MSIIIIIIGKMKRTKHGPNFRILLEFSFWGPKKCFKSKRIRNNKILKKKNCGGS